MPVLAVGGAASFGAAVGDSLQPLANDLQSLVVPGAGHRLAEPAPEGRPRWTLGKTIAVNVGRAHDARRRQTLGVTGAANVPRAHLGGAAGRCRRRRGGRGNASTELRRVAAAKQSRPNATSANDRSIDRSVCPASP